MREAMKLARNKGEASGQLQFSRKFKIGKKLELSNKTCLEFIAMIMAIPDIAICGLNKVGISAFIKQLTSEVQYCIPRTGY
jgi:hypothetical protein